MEGEKNLFETSKNSAGYPQYEFRKAEAEADMLDEKIKRGWLNDKQREFLRVTLLSLGIALSAAKDSNESAEDREQKPMPKYVQMDNPHNDALHEALENETLESLEERMSISSCLEQNGSLEDCLDELSLKVRDFAKTLSEEDVRQTAALASKVSFNPEAIEFRSEPDQKRDRPALPKRLQENLKDILMALISQESRFKKDARSSSGAIGYGQIKPNTWQEYKGATEVSEDLKEHIEVMGEFISDNYHYILDFAGEDALSRLRNRFDSEADFIDKFMTPAVINAYNAGGPTVGKAIKEFSESTKDDELKSGTDIYSQFSEFALKNHEGYGVDQAEYVPRIYAFNSELGKRLQDLDKKQG